MKSFQTSVTLLALMGGVHATEFYSQESYSWTDISTQTPVDLFGTYAAPSDDGTINMTAPVWYVYPQTVFKVNTGEQYIRLHHYLFNDVLSNQIVELKFAYTTGSGIVVDPVNILAEDAAECTMIQNTQDTRFWVQSARDGYYRCSTFSAGCTPDDATDWTDDASGSDTDWTIPIIDEDKDNPFCTASSTDGITCQEIKCIHERAFDTGNDDDFSLYAIKATDSAAAVDDSITIRGGRGTFGVNTLDEAGTAADSSTASYTSTISDVTITVVAGAQYLASASLAIATAASMFLQ